MKKEELIRLIDLDYSQRMIAEELNTSQSNVKYWLKKLNLKTNKNKFNIIDKDEKFCPKCKTIKPLDDFYKRTNRNSVGGYCKKCSNEYHTERVKNVKIRIVNYMGGQCTKCSLKLENSHYSVFDLHHLDPKEKDINFKRLKFQKWETIKKEADKCILVCSNCHRIIHAKD